MYLSASARLKKARCLPNKARGLHLPVQRDGPPAVWHLRGPDCRQPQYRAHGLLQEPQGHHVPLSRADTRQGVLGVPTCGGLGYHPQRHIAHKGRGTDRTANARPDRGIGKHAGQSVRRPPVHDGVR